MIGKWLKSIRESWELTSQDMITAMGVSPTLISLIENDKRVPSVKFLEAYLDTLSKAANLDDRLRVKYLSDENFEKWRKNLTVIDKEGEKVYRSQIGKILTLESELHDLSSEKLKEYFLNYSWRDLAYYQRDFFQSDNFKPTKHRLNKMIDLIEVLKIEEEITNYWHNKFLTELTDLIKNNIGDLPPGYQKILKSFNRPVLAVEPLQQGAIDLNQLLDSKMRLDGKILTPLERELLTTLIEGIRVRRKTRQG